MYGNCPEVVDEKLGSWMVVYTCAQSGQQNVREAVHLLLVWDLQSSITAVHSTCKI
jgi:hypothetical protein